VGAGVLSLPHVLSYYGLTMGILLLLGAAYLTYLSYMYMNEAVEKSGKKSYANVCSYYFGNSMARINVFILIILNFVAMALYTTISWSFIERLLKDYDIVDLTYIDAKTSTFEEYNSKSYITRTICMMGANLILFPLNAQRKINSIRYFALGILIIILYTIALTVVEAPMFYNKYKGDPDYEINWLVRMPTMNWLPGLATITLSYSAHPAFFLIRSEMKNKSPARIQKLVGRAIATEFLFYLAIAVAGYISLGNNLIPGVFTLRTKLDEDSNDYAMKIA
jgi:amino acid permease